MIKLLTTLYVRSDGGYPDYKKSGRAYMRLAETNLINGQYAVAAKYLRALQHTLFYKKWATNAMSYLNNDEKIEKHPEWGWLRKSPIYRRFLVQRHGNGCHAKAYCCNITKVTGWLSSIC